MPIDRGILEQQLHGLRESSRWWEERELRDLPAILHSNEQVLAVSRGKLARIRWLRKSWLIVVTDQRLICVQSSRRISWRQMDVPASHVTRVTLSIGVFKARVYLIAGGQRYRMLVPRADGYKLLTAISSWGPAGKDAMAGFGPSLMVRRVVDHVLALPSIALDPNTPALAPKPPAPQVAKAPDPQVEVLEDQVEELRRHIDFLEELLKERHQSAPGSRQLGS